MIALWEPVVSGTSETAKVFQFWRFSDMRLRDLKEKVFPDEEVDVRDLLEQLRQETSSPTKARLYQTLSELTGINYHTFAHWNNGSRTPSPSSVRALQAILYLLRMPPTPSLRRRVVARGCKADVNRVSPPGH